MGIADQTRRWAGMEPGATVRRVIVPGIPDVGAWVATGREESHHVLHVLRAGPGERFRLADGVGGAAIGVLMGPEAGGLATFEVVERLPTVVAPPRVVVLGVPKPALLEEAVTLGTEGGATHFLLVRARYSPPGEVRAERLDRVLRAAVTQCGRADLPAVVAARPLGEALRDEALAGVAARWLATPQAPRAPRPPPATPAGPGVAPPSDAHVAAPEAALLSGARAPDSDAAAVAIGPEGGWSEAEVDALTAAGFAPLGLGPFVLRTPSAVGAALARLWESGAAGRPS